MSDDRGILYDVHYRSRFTRNYGHTQGGFTLAHAREIAEHAAMKNPDYIYWLAQTPPPQPHDGPRGAGEARPTGERQ